MKCIVCGKDISLKVDNHYVARNGVTTGLVNMMKSDEEPMFDAYDCEACGSQNIAQERKRTDEDFTAFRLAEQQKDIKTEERIPYPETLKGVLSKADFEAGFLPNTNEIDHIIVLVADNDKDKLSFRDWLKTKDNKEDDRKKNLKKQFDDAKTKEMKGYIASGCFGKFKEKEYCQESCSCKKECQEQLSKNNKETSAKPKEYFKDKLENEVKKADCFVSNNEDERRNFKYKPCDGHSCKRRTECYRYKISK